MTYNENVYSYRERFNFRKVEPYQTPTQTDKSDGRSPRIHRSPMLNAEAKKYRVKNSQPPQWGVPPYSFILLPFRLLIFLPLPLPLPHPQLHRGSPRGRHVLEFIVLILRVGFVVVGLDLHYLL